MDKKYCDNPGCSLKNFSIDPGAREDCLECGKVLKVALDGLFDKLFRDPFGEGFVK